MINLRINYLIAFKAMKMSRRSADASQRSLAYNRIVDALNEFRYIFSSCHNVELFHSVHREICLFSITYSNKISFLKFLYSIVNMRV